MNGAKSTCVGGSNGRVGDIAAAAVLWGLWVLSVVPLAVLFVEFDDRASLFCVGASYYAKLYGHIFVYPVTFGFLATVFLTRPWLHTARSIRSLRSPKRRRVVAFLVVSIVGIVSFASWTDFTKATPALWSFKAAVCHETEGVIGDAHKILNARCIASATEFKKENGAKPQENEKPLDILKGTLGKDSRFSRSLTEWAYYVGFIGNTTWMALLFGVVVARTGADDRSQLGQTVAAMALATAWVPFRGAFLVEKMELYTDDLLPLNYLIFLAFVVLYLHILRLYTTGLDSWRRQVVLWTGNLIVVILALLSSLIGPLVDAGLLGDGADILVKYFGSKSTLLNYIAMLLLFLVMVAPAVVRRLRSGPMS